METIELNQLNVLITGGYGFIGSMIGEKFYNEGANIFIIDNLSTGNASNVTYKHRFFHFNIEDAMCESVFRLHPIDIVIHCAAQTSVQHSMGNPINDSYSNVFGLLRMLIYAKKYNVKHFVFTSSAAVYGDLGRDAITEQSQLAPLSIYGLNKKIGEMYCNKWKKFYKLPMLIYRFANVYGANQSLTSNAIVPVLLNKITTNERLTVFGDGNQTRDFLYVRDVADAVVKGVSQKLEGTYNLSTNEEVSINELIEIIHTFGYPLRVVYEKERLGDIKHSRLCNEKITEALGWKAEVSIKKGLHKCLQQLRVKNSVY